MTHFYVSGNFYCSQDLFAKKHAGLGLELQLALGLRFGIGYLG